jgi:serine/threonine protein kinase
MIHQDNDYCHPTDTKRHGVHGDLKPENILWFRDFGGPEEGYSLGTLKISDFGLTGFHETLSKSRINVEGMGGSPTYRAPEYDVYHAVSQSYDIWSLACVLLEFVTWYFKGWEGVDQFSKARRLEDKSLFIPSDTFFNSIYSGQSMSAMAKKSVVKVSHHRPSFLFSTSNLLTRFRSFKVFTNMNTLRISRLNSCNLLKKDYFG